jgi:hypothetical protein
MDAVFIINREAEYFSFLNNLLIMILKFRQQCLALLHFLPLFVTSQIWTHASERSPCALLKDSPCSISCRNIGIRKVYICLAFHSLTWFWGVGSHGLKDYTEYKIVCHNAGRQRKPSLYAFFSGLACYFSQYIACRSRDICTGTSAILSSSEQYWCVGWVWACGWIPSGKIGT